MSESDFENEVAPEGWVWRCNACGKRSRDLYGFQRIDRGYDEACVLNAVLVPAETDDSSFGADDSVERR